MAVKEAPAVTMGIHIITVSRLRTTRSGTFPNTRISGLSISKIFKMNASLYKRKI
jgi:hypothetical protein